MRDPLDFVVLPTLRERFLLEPEELPALKRELELRLKMLDVAEHANAAVKEQVQANLEDIANAERALRELESE